MCGTTIHCFFAHVNWLVSYSDMPCGYSAGFSNVWMFFCEFEALNAFTYFLSALFRLVSGWMIWAIKDACMPFIWWDARQSCCYEFPVCKWKSGGIWAKNDPKMVFVVIVTPERLFLGYAASFRATKRVNLPTRSGCAWRRELKIYLTDTIGISIV